MAELIPERLAELRKSAGISQAELARRVGIGQSSANRLEAGGTRNPRQIIEIARVLGTTPEYLTGESDDPLISATGEQRPALHGQPPAKSDTVELQEFDVSYGLGASYIHDAAPEGRTRVFSRSWIRQFTDSPFEYLLWGRGIGDSMTPTIMDADVVLIDTFQRSPKIWDKLWAVEVGGLGAIKRLRPTRDGSGMRLLSSNPDVPEEVVFDEEMTVIGRVVAIVRKV